MLEGIKANRNERRRWNESRDVRLCPILFADAWGFFVVMPYARPLTDDEFRDAELEYIMDGARMFNRTHPTGDFKRENYGIHDNKVVKIDYES